MRYLSIDIETTGLDRDKDQIIEFGAILEDTNNPLPFEEVPKFHKYVKHDRYEGGAYALALNQRIFEILAKGEDKNIVSEYALMVHFHQWLSHGQQMVKPIVAGKNFRDFDYEFLIKIKGWSDRISFKRRVLDPAVLFWNPLEDDDLPNQDTCLQRAGIEGVVDHTAIGDAWQVIQLLRTKYVT